MEMYSKFEFPVYKILFMFKVLLFTKIYHYFKSIVSSLSINAHAQNSGTEEFWHTKYCESFITGIINKFRKIQYWGR